jgi:DtxR family Mn-dependent transcriptional regulator
MDRNRVLQELSAHERETLSAIMKLSTADSPVRPGQLVKELRVSPATITARLKKLHELGLAEHIPYAGVTLTEPGSKIAVTVVRRHRIVERFLVDVLEYEWAEAQLLARRFEHALPREVVHRIYDHLGRPDACPHGFPIPPLDSESLPQLRSLAELDPGEAAEIAVPANTDPEVVSYLDEIGVRPGVRVRVIEKLPFEGPLKVAINGTERTVGNKLARLLSVTTSDRSF